MATAIGLLAAMPVALASQCPSGGTSCTVTINLPVNDVISLTLSTSATALGTPRQADFAAGGLVAAASGPTATVKANGAYALAVKANTAAFSYVGSFTNPNKPATDLTWATGTGAAPGSCTGISTFGQNAGTASNLLSSNTGAPAIGIAAPSLKICYRTLWAFSNSPPGTYSLVVNFTLSGP